MRTEIPADRSQWLAIRAWGAKQANRDMTIAHSAPIYVVVDGEPIVKQEALADLVGLQRTRLREFMTEPVDPVGDLEPWETLGLMQEEWERQQADLRPRVEEADAHYQELLERATAASVERVAWPFDLVRLGRVVWLVAVTGLLALIMKLSQP